MELRRERDELMAEQTALTALLEDDAAQRKSVAEDVKAIGLRPQRYTAYADCPSAGMMIRLMLAKRSDHSDLFRRAACD